jgi:hypothetical protein
MPKAPDKDQFIKTFDDLTKSIDVDDSAGRSVPINMNFTETSYLTKDTGSSMFGATETELCHSEFNYKKKDGTSYRIRAKGTTLQKYNTTTSLWETLTSGVFTVTIASPAVVSQTAHGLAINSPVSFSTTGVLPTGITAGTTYYVIATGFTANTFQISLTVGGTAVITTGTQSGVHTLSRSYTSGAEFGFYVYSDVLYGGNSYENYFSWTGSVFTEYSTAPKGNILEIFEDRMFVAGVRASPTTIYFTEVSQPTNFASNLIQPLGEDSVTSLVNYYGSLLVFKKETIWKITFTFDQVSNIYLGKYEIQSKNYGACSRKAVSWVENDIWFFTGREVRSIGYQDNNTGVLGINKTVISEQIKETLKLINISNFDLINTFYKDRRFYLSIPLNTSTNDTVFVCHLLYSSNWTKYTNRVKANAYGFIEVNDVLYSNLSSGSYGTLKWDDNVYSDIGVVISSEVFFKKIENNEFNVANTYRYCDLIFKDLQGVVTATLRQDLHNGRTTKTNSFYIGTDVEGEENSIGEVDFGELLIADSYGEDVVSTPFLRSKLSFLSKAQSITFGLSNNELLGRFTIAQYSVSGFKDPVRYFDKTQITNLN